MILRVLLFGLVEILRVEILDLLPLDVEPPVDPDGLSPFGFVLPPRD
uniref:Minor tail protein n=1 Tax=Mycobacterium phage Pharb TaxID=3136626 RepID=A0AAU8GNR6_9VIRU